MYATLASFSILMQIFTSCNRENGEGASICSSVGGMLNVVQQEYPNILSTGEVPRHLRDIFHGLHKQLHSMCYLYDDLRVMYPQLMTVAHNAKYEQEDRPGQGVQVRLAQSEGKDDIMSLKEQIV